MIRTLLPFGGWDVWQGVVPIIQGHANLREATSLEVLVWWMLAGEVPLAQWQVRDNMPLPLGGLSEMALDARSFPRRSRD